MVMNTNSNSVGRQFSRGGRNKPTENNKSCQCNNRQKDKNSNVFEFKSIIQCLFKKMLKYSWTKTLAKDTFENRLLSIMLAVNVGNFSNMNENDMKRLILQSEYNCEKELPDCFYSCKLLLSKLLPLINTF